VARLLSICFATLLLPAGCAASAADVGRASVSGAHPCSVVAFGDSITWGAYASIDVVPVSLAVTPVADHVVGPEDTSYPGDLARILHASVCNYGIPGEMAQQGRTRFGQLVRHYRPRLLVLLEGVNDLPARRSDADIVRDLAAMRREARRHRERLLVGTLTPTYYRPTDPRYYLNARVAALTDAIRVWARREHQPLADINRAFARKRRAWRLFADGLHPNDAGYRLLAESVASAIHHDHLPY
jgi:lysophospholipase L1-like esterase